MRAKFTSRAAIALAGASALFSSSCAYAQIASALIREGEEAAGPGITVTGIDLPAANGVNGYSFITGHSDALDRVFGNATGGARMLMRTEGTINGMTQTAFEGFFGMSDSGSLAYGPTLSTPTRDCVWADDTVCLNQGDAIAALPGQNSVFNSDPNMTHTGVPYWFGGFGPATTTTNRAFFMGTTPTVIIKGGDSIPNAGLTLSTSFTAFGNRMSADGSSYIMNHSFAAPATTANDSFILVNGNMYMAGGGGVREGSPVPAAIGGLPGELWANWDAVAVNNAGDAFFTGDTNAATTVDEFVFVNGAIALREGTAIMTPIGPGTVLGDIEWGDANETNDWAVTWDATVAAVNLETLIVNGQSVLIETQLVDWNGDGVIDAGDNNGKLADFTGIRSLAIGERMVGFGGETYFDVFFTADIDFLGTPSATDDLEGGFRFRFVVPEPGSLSLLAGAGLLALRRRRR